MPKDFSGGGAVGPRSASFSIADQADNTLPLPRVEASPPFLLAWHAAQYQVLGGQVLPYIREVGLRPGVANVTRNKDGSYNMGALKRDLERKGWRILPRELGPDGDYIMEWDVSPDGRNRRISHHTPWVTLYAGSDAVRSDVESYASWIRSLVDAGTVPACPAYVAEKLLERKERTLQDHEEHVLKGNLSRIPMRDAVAEEVEVLKSYLARDDVELAPAKPRGRKTKAGAA